MLMKLLPAIERIFNVTLHLLACVVLWGCLTGGAAWAQYSDDLKDIQHDIGDIHVFPGFHEPRPIGHLGEVDSVVDLRGFVPMSLSSKTAGGWLTNLRWYKIPTRKALLLLYFGTLSVSHVADDTTSLEKRALSENLTERPLLRNFLHPLNREEPTVVTAIRLAGDTEEGTGLGEMRREQGYD